MSTEGWVTTPLGPLRIRVAAGQLVAIELSPAVDRQVADPDEPLLRRARQQLDAYFDDPHHRFDLPLALAGSPFQRRVWQALQTIPAGETLTYGELARRLDSGARAVGNACRRNPLPLVIPCHRVVAASGLGGYAGAREGRRLAIKRWLLKHEGAIR